MANYQDDLPENYLDLHAIQSFEACEALTKTMPIRLELPVMFPEVPVQVRDLLREFGLGARSIEVRGHVYTVLDCYYLSMQNWISNCGSNSIPKKPVKITKKIWEIEPEQFTRAVLMIKNKSYQTRPPTDGIMPRVTSNVVPLTLDIWENVTC